MQLHDYVFKHINYHDSVLVHLNHRGRAFKHTNHRNKVFKHVVHLDSSLAQQFPRLRLQVFDSHDGVFKQINYLDCIS